MFNDWDLSVNCLQWVCPSLFHLKDQRDELSSGVVGVADTTKITNQKDVATFLWKKICITIYAEINYKNSIQTL